MSVLVCSPPRRDCRSRCSAQIPASARRRPHRAAAISFVRDGADTRALAHSLALPRHRAADLGALTRFLITALGLSTLSALAALAMAPPTFADLGKQARDIFGKGYSEWQRRSRRT